TFLGARKWLAPFALARLSWLGGPRRSLIVGFGERRYHEVMSRREFLDIDPRILRLVISPPSRTVCHDRFREARCSASPRRAERGVSRVAARPDDRQPRRGRTWRDD